MDFAVADFRDPNPLNEMSPFENITCASFPASNLAALAGLRRGRGISVLRTGERCWVYWLPGDEQVLRALYPIEKVELYERKGEAWHRFGHRLPSFEVPASQDAISIERAVLPGSFESISPGESSPIPSKLRLVREGSQMPSTAALCSLAELARWADSAPTNAIESIRGAIRSDHALLLGRGLPAWPGSVRYWGEQVLVPIGFRVRPGLPEKAILDALGASGLELARFVQNEADKEDAQVEVIPLDAFRPLTRAGVRLAVRARSS